MLYLRLATAARSVFKDEGENDSSRDGKEIGFGSLSEGEEESEMSWL